jgi:hypothetical protein
MKVSLKIALIGIATTLTLTQAHAMRWYSPSTAHWLTRDPIGERGGANLYGFVKNQPTVACDPFGFATYSIENLPPTGWWMLSLADVQVGEATFKGFHSRYLPADWRFGHPACPCRKENILLVQVVKDPLYPVQFDAGPNPGQLPPHSPNDPVPGYYVSAPADPLTIVDAPHVVSNPNWSATWRFEDCAICRTRPDASSVNDQVLGCIKFAFHRIDQKTAEISVEAGGSVQSGQKVYVVTAEAPGKLWSKALQDWVARGK